MDDAFLAALAANFDDETTRLVYADWLDERGDPRGPFLRAEVEWARLHLDDEAFPAAMRHFSIAQRGIDPTWVERVSRLPALVHQTWNSTAHHFEKLIDSIHYDELKLSWPGWVGEIYKAICLHLGAASVAQRFCVPADYDVFMNVIRGGWRCRDTRELDLFDAGGVAAATDDYCGRYEKSCRLDDGLWLNIGAVGLFDSDSHLLCCDCDHHLFGHVVEGDGGAHPWFYRHEGMTVLAPTFLQYVQNVLAELHLYGSPVGTLRKSADDSA